MFGLEGAGSGPSAVLESIERERWRQWRKLIMIPSESICLPEAASVLGSELGNIYAEGYPQPILCQDPRRSALDPDRFESWQVRLSDRRFYKGCSEVNVIETLAHHVISQVFSILDGSPGPDDIHVNVQALSGAAANVAVYEAFLRPGDAVMGLDLTHGGHLTHGSEYNISGKTYRVVHYGIDPETRRLDYEAIRVMAAEVRPRLIVAGASAYPWDMDWAALRLAADESGALLLADVAHLAGMIVAGELNNPLPHADVVTFTTHKTLCGPRGAVILTTDPDRAAAVNAAVFPGLQGGPHMNTVGAIARLFEIILDRRPEYAAFQQKVIRNAASLATALQSAGFTLEYGGTNTHMVLADLKKFAPVVRVGNALRGGPPVDGETAARLLEIAGIVVNKNTLPGDRDAGASSGIRLGTPWVTQRGITEEQIAEVAGIIHDVLSEVRTTKVWVPGNMERCRGRLRPEILGDASERTLAIVEALPWPERAPEARKGAARPEGADKALFELRGDKVRLALGQMLTCRISELGEGDSRAGFFLDSIGEVIGEAAVVDLGRRDREEVFGLVTCAGQADVLRAWIEGLSDGYLLFDADDLYAKVDGPTVVEDVTAACDDARLLEVARYWTPAIPEDREGPLRGEGFLATFPDRFDLTKPYFVGQLAIYSSALPPPKRAYVYQADEIPLRRTVLNEAHRSLGARMVPFAGWEMPVHYPTGIFEEHRAVRTAAGLFDVSHMSVFEISGAQALAFLDAVLANCVSRLDPGQAGYNYLLYPDGTAADDVFVYRIGPDRFWVVVNAANAERDWDWIEAANSGEVIIDPAMPGKRLDGPVEMRNLREAGDESRIDLALQGPASLDLLRRLAGPLGGATELGRIRQNEFIEVDLAGIPVVAARTGYTGERIGFELFVHPDRAVELWEALLDAGRPAGVIPAGLGARDSTRLEAGFPLFGHELEGDQAGTLTEADYGYVPRFHVPFFIGRSAYISRTAPRGRRLVRLRGQGGKTVREGHIILDQGKAVGTVTSFAFLDAAKNFAALAYVDEGFEPEPGARVLGFRAKEIPEGETVDERKIVELTALPRFPDDEERHGWIDRYRKKED